MLDNGCCFISYAQMRACVRALRRINTCHKQILAYICGLPTHLFPPPSHSHQDLCFLNAILNGFTLAYSFETSHYASEFKLETAEPDFNESAARLILTYKCPLISGHSNASKRKQERQWEKFIYSSLVPALSGPSKPISK